MNIPRSLCLLVVADGPGDARQLQLAVQRSPFAVKSYFVDDGSSALRFLLRQGDCFQHAPRPDLVFLVNGVSGQDGLEFLAKVKQDEHLRAIPVVIMSSSEIEADVRAAYRLGAAGYMLKPAGSDELNDAMGKLAQYWFGRMRLPENNEICTD